MQKNWFTILNVMVTVRVYIIKVWLFLLCLVNCWSVCNQTWFDNIASCGKMGLLHSRSVSQWRFKCQWMFVQMIYSESQKILLPNLVWWCSIMSLECHADFFFFFFFWGGAIFKVKVTVRAHMIKICECAWENQLFLLFLCKKLG